MAEIDVLHAKTPKEGRKNFFFEKKKQKTFAFWACRQMWPGESDGVCFRAPERRANSTLAPDKRASDSRRDAFDDTL